MSVSQQLLHSQLSLALWTCQQLPPCSRIRHRICQLLEVAIDLATCADTPLGCPDPSLWPSTAWPCPTAHQQQHPACAPPHWQQHAQPNSQHVPPTAPTGFCPAAPPSQHTNCAPPDTNKWQYAAAGREKVRGKRRCRRILGSQTRGGRGAGSSNNAPSTSPPAQPHTSPVPGKPSRFGVQEAEVHGTAGMSAQEVSTLAAAVRGLSSRYGPVQTAAALKLQELTALWPHPAAVAEALVEVDAIQDLTTLLSSSTSTSSTCKAAAAAALCNIGWYPAACSSMLAAGTVPMLAAMLWDEAHACRTEAACALFALTSSHDELACAAVVAAGGIPRLVGLLAASADSNDGSSSSSGVDVGASTDGGDGESSSAPAGCNNAADGGSSSEHDATDSPRPQPEAAAAAAPDAAATAAAVAVLGNLAAGSAARRAEIATTGDALLRIVACLSSPHKELRLAAVRALLHITYVDCWRLTDGLVVAQVKAAGALAAVQALVDLSASDLDRVDETCEAFQLWAQLNALPPPLIGHHPEAGWEVVGGLASA